MSDLYYDRQGNPMTVLEWAKAFEGDSQALMSLKRVAETTLPDGKWVSTVWLGIDHSFGMRIGPPVVFETMVFNTDALGSELDCDRYCTEAEAVAGHAAMVEKWLKVPA